MLCESVSALAVVGPAVAVNEYVPGSTESDGDVGRQCSLRSAVPVSCGFHEIVDRGELGGQERGHGRADEPDPEPE